jgi:phosphatidylethanolamine/phosphatidyl-N-methylethanolamine N-methyltransferase
MLLRDSMNTSSSDHLVFLRSLLHSPRDVGAIFPSSPRLSHLMASQVDPQASAILEIGAGTGPVTKALLKRGVSSDRLVVVERDPAMAAHLRQHFPAVRVRCADALHASRILSDESEGKVPTVVSSLPLRNFPPAERIAMVEAMMKALAPGGQLIQFTYALGCPIPSKQMGLHAQCLGRVWRNLPPAAVWRFRFKNEPAE